MSQTLSAFKSLVCGHMDCEGQEVEVRTIWWTGLYRIQVFWQDNPDVVNNFIIRHINEDTMRNWFQDIESQRANQFGMMHNRISRP